LFLVDSKKIGSSIRFKELLELPRLLKSNFLQRTQKTTKYDIFLIAILVLLT
jgi:hypothetical protein